MRKFLSSPNYLSEIEMQEFFENVVNQLDALEQELTRVSEAQDAAIAREGR